MPTPKPPRILLGSEVDPVETGSVPTGETISTEPSRHESPATRLSGEVLTGAGDRSLALIGIPDAGGASQTAAEPASGPETPGRSDAVDAGPSLPPGLPAVGSSLLVGEAGRLWGAFAYRQMTRALEGLAETSRCRTPLDVLGLQQRLVQQTLQDCAAFGIDLATVPMRSMTAPPTVCRPDPAA